MWQFVDYISRISISSICMRPWLLIMSSQLLNTYHKISIQYIRFKWDRKLLAIEVPYTIHVSFHPINSWWISISWSIWNPFSLFCCGSLNTLDEIFIIVLSHISDFWMLKWRAWKSGFRPVRIKFKETEEWVRWHFSAILFTPMCYKAFDSY